MRVHPKDWMDVDLINDWLHHVWKKRVGGLTQRRGLLIFHAFHCNKTNCTEVTLQ